jgi:hypothetical protein
VKTDPQVKAFWSTSIAAGALALLHQLVQAQLAYCQPQKWDEHRRTALKELSMQRAARPDVHSIEV